MRLSIFAPYLPLASDSPYFPLGRKSRSYTVIPIKAFTLLTFISERKKVNVLAFNSRLIEEEGRGRTMAVVSHSRCQLPNRNQIQRLRSPLESKRDVAPPNVAAKKPAVIPFSTVVSGDAHAIVGRYARTRRNTGDILLK